MYGGDSSSVQDQLQNVQHICGTHHAFAAILADGSVVTWGNQANMVVTAPESNVSLCTSRNLGACQGKNEHIPVALQLVKHLPVAHSSVQNLERTEPGPYSR